MAIIQIYSDRLIFIFLTDGMIDLLLPRAFENFPQDPQLLFALATTLASANEDSCNKVLKLIFISIYKVI